MRTILLTALLSTGVAVAEQPPAKKASAQRKVRFNKHLLLAFLPPGLTLGGPVPADASGGGQGALTGVFINGRELHPLDVVGLQQLIGQVWPGRWWVDAQGNYGLENGPALGNLALLARAHQSSGSRQAWSKHYEGTSPGGNMNLASTTTCVSTANYSHCTGE